MDQKLKNLICAPWETYAEAKQRSESIDVALGFQINEVEQKLRKNSGDRQDWARLSPQAFQTPYPELAEIVGRFQEPQSLRWLDLGAAYGRLGFVLSILRPQDFFYGCEFVPERVQHAAHIFDSHGLSQSRMHNIDLNQIRAGEFPESEILFLFDFGQPSEISRLLQEIRVWSESKPLTLIGRGRATRHLVHRDHPWLAQVEEAFHAPHYSIYRNSAQSAGSCLLS